jgi:hypothetical protein
VRRTLLVLTLTTLACDAESLGGGVTTPVLQPEALMAVDAAHDPFASHRPAEIDCPPGAWGPEGGGFEVQTGVCNYAAFDQPLPVDVRAGDTIFFNLWHDTLDAHEHATAHVALWLSDEVLWEDEVDIPAPSGVLEAMVELEKTPPEGARVGLHLHNHGFNSWRWVALDVITTE